MISIIIPTYNEADYIENVLKFLETADPEAKEIIVIDGGSTDNTVEILNSWKPRLPGLKILNNPHRFVPYALNLAIKKSTGDPIIRLDAHTEYEDNYLIKILDTFKKTGADVVGGPMLKKGKTSFQKAAAFATSTRFGIGDSKIHQSGYSGKSDHVYLGAWKRDLFKEFGDFDERLVRNQDDEFHYRIKSHGKTIYLNSEIKSYYYPRKNLFLLFKQYFEYGKYKPLVLKKISSEIKYRHLTPPAFIIYIAALFTGVFYPLILLPLGIYILLLIYYSLINKNKPAVKVHLLLIFPAIHLAYGMGFLAGLPLLFYRKNTNS